MKYWHVTNPLLTPSPPLLHIGFRRIEAEENRISVQQFIDLGSGLVPAPDGLGASVSIIEDGVLPKVYVSGKFIVCDAIIAQRIAEKMADSVQCLRILECPDDRWLGKKAMYIHKCVNGINMDKVHVIAGTESSLYPVFSPPLPLEMSMLPPSPACFRLIENGYNVADDDAKRIMVKCGIPGSNFSSWEFQYERKLGVTETGG